MDNNVILEQKQLFEQLVQAISSPYSFHNEATRKTVENELQRFATDESLWPVLSDALFSQSQEVVFQAARIIKDQISSGHFESSRFVIDGKHVVLDSLVRAFLFHSKRLSEPIVTKAVASALTQCFLQPHFRWGSPIRALLYALNSPSDGLSLVVPDVDLVWGFSVTYRPLEVVPVLYFIQDLAEEVLQTCHLGQAGANRSQKLKSEAQDAWLAIHSVLQAFNIRAGLLSPDFVLHGDVFASAHDENLPLLIFTRQENIDLEESTRDIIGRSLNFIFGCFEVLPGEVIDTLTTAIEEAPRILKLVPSRQFLTLFVSGQANGIRESLKRGNFSAEDVRFADMAVAYAKDLSFTDSSYTSSDAWHSVCPILYDLVDCSGVANIEDTVCSPALEVWVDIADGLDLWNDTNEASDFAHRNLSVVIRSLKAKARYPPQEMQRNTSNWDESERADFETFRRDFGDFMLSCYSSMGSMLLQDLNHGLCKALLSLQWDEVEVNLTALTSFAAVRAEKADLIQCVEEIFSTNPWLNVCSGDISHLPGKVVKAAIRLVAELGPYFKTSQQYLSENIGLVIRSLSHPECSSEAATALQRLCLNLRDVLVTRFEDLFQILWQYLLPGTPVSIEQKQKIFGAIATVIEALPNEEIKYQSTTHIVNSLDFDILDMLNKHQTDAECASILATQLMRTLAEIAKGLKPPQTIENTPEDFKSINAFWAQENPSRLRHRLFGYVYDTARAFRTNSDVIEACCVIVQAGHTTWPKTAFTATSTENKQFLCLLIYTNVPNVDVVLKTASSFLKLHSNDPGTIQQEYVSIVNHISIEQQRVMRYPRDLDIQEFSFATLDFYAETLQNYAALLLSVCHDNDVEILFAFAFACLDEEDILPRRSAASFWSAFFSRTGHPSPLVLPPSSAADRLPNLLRLIGERFAGSIFCQLAGKCPRSELNILSGPLKSFISSHGILASELLPAVARDPKNVSSTVADSVPVPARERFVQSILRLRGARTTNEAVRRFWHDCRGSAFQYTA